MAYMGGVTMENLNKFYEILCTGMSSSREEFPIITYRNYLLSRPYHKIDKEDILRCQYAISKYLAKSCAAKLYLPKDYIYPIPWKDGQETLNLK